MLLSKLSIFDNSESYCHHLCEYACLLLSNLIIIDNNTTSYHQDEYKTLLLLSCKRNHFLEKKAKFTPGKSSKTVPCLPTFVMISHCRQPIKWHKFKRQKSVSPVASQDIFDEYQCSAIILFDKGKESRRRFRTADLVTLNSFANSANDRAIPGFGEEENLIS